ncbi:GPI ethanolamine phosphate transferase 1 isoform X2 [Daktulosphaira vitifoliae]|uniref:GPI ethanolamine phosphate transferase 1 isoform X2 n=1 Tax=Daktulosphaira vitifoliae TaxID=58002 RepID=UPI0021AAE4D5|nr:GPI ethanolamine phosphate transferase 1 isoform X2 [Daktulosphaira vitifoliae]
MMLNLKISILGFIIQISLLVSIFDIYFKSPIINGIPDQYVLYEPPADRLVLFIADGLRADTFYDHVENGHSTFFKNIFHVGASYGFCHTRVPTESRPGHIALIAGFYEDPSAIFKGWKENIVNFDSVFNKSDLTISWGSPDIVSIFQKGSNVGNVITYYYEPNLQDFTGKNGSSALLSKWVFDKVKLYFETSKVNHSIHNMLKKRKLILFLHLLGTDISGHIDKPHSKEYLENLKVIENGIKDTVDILETFYNDNRTAYIFTSDHGMTDWGSHGDGSISETEVPFVTWGAGLSKVSNQINSLKLNIKQIDIAPLMATIIGVPIPVNSVGVLPLELFSTDINEKAKYLLVNAFQLNAAFSTIREQIEKQSFQWFYVPFKPLHQKIQKNYLDEITVLLNESKFDDCIKLCYEWIDLSLNGIDYYNTYFKLPLLLCVTLISFGWITLLIIETINTRSYRNKNNTTIIIVSLSFLLMAILCTIFIYAQSLPLQFYVYSFLPLIVWWICIFKLLRKISLVKLSKLIFEIDKNIFVEMLLYFIGIELLVWTFFERCLLSLALLINSLWMTYSSFKYGFSLDKIVIIFLSSAWFSSFPMILVIDGHKNIMNVILGGVVWLLAGLMHAKNKRGLYKMFAFTQVALLGIAILNVSIVSNSIDNKLGLNFYNQILSWAISIVAVCIYRKSQDLINNVTSLFISLSVTYIQLSINMEVVFILVLTVTLACWRKIILRSNNSTNSLRTQWSCAFFFLLFSFGSFFGTGNIASINSFDPSIGQCFVSVFSPFTIFGLVLFKIIVPIMLTCCTFYITCVKLKIPPSNVFSLMLALSNVMGLHFLFFIKNTGSWLDIGMSISHYVIVQSLAIFLSLLYGLAALLIGVNKNYKGQDEFQLLPVGKNHNA